MSEGGAVLPSKAWNRSKHQHSYHQKKRHSNKDPKKKINPSLGASQPQQPNESAEEEEDADAEEQDEDQQKAKMEQTVVELPESEFEDRPYTLQELIDASRDDFSSFHSPS